MVYTSQVPISDDYYARRDHNRTAYDYRDRRAAVGDRVESVTTTLRAPHTDASLSKPQPTATDIKEGTEVEFHREYAVLNTLCLSRRCESVVDTIATPGAQSQTAQANQTADIVCQKDYGIVWRY